MSRMLHISASPRGKNSESIAIAESLLAAYRESHPDDTVETFDLWEGTLPEFGPAAAAAKMTALAGRELEGDEAAAWRGAYTTFERFNSYDNYVFSVPMWNHGIPYILKQFIDVVSQSGMLFSIDPDHGYTGLLTSKKAAVIYTTAVYGVTSAPAFGQDYHSTYFDYWLRFQAGITDITSISYRANLFSTDADIDRQIAHASARAAGKGF
jgi:FMN-dependent NADH-azoreductase